VPRLRRASESIRGIAGSLADADQTCGGDATAAMRIGDIVLYRGQEFILRGVDPMSVVNRQAELLDPRTGEVLRVPLDEVSERPDRAV
jgi:hypothetical protein